jgi:hypothetical protein
MRISHIGKRGTLFWVICAEILFNFALVGAADGAVGKAWLFSESIRCTDRVSTHPHLYAGHCAMSVGKGGDSGER